MHDMRDNIQKRKPKKGMHGSKGICNRSVATVSAEVRELPTRPYSPTNTRCIKTQHAVAQTMNCGSLNRSTRRIGANKTRQGIHPEPRLLRQPALEALTNFARTDSPRRIGRNEFWRLEAAAAACLREGGGDFWCLGTCVTLNGSGIQLAVGPQPLWLRNHNSGLAQWIMVKRLATSPHDPLGITDSACKNQSIVVSVQYGPFNPYIPIRSTTIGKSRVAIDPIAMHISWRSNSDIASVTSIGYPRMSASGESSTTMHRLLHASGSHPIPTPYDPNTTKTSDLSTRQMVTTWKVRTRVVR
ncbi:pentatricopeptide repeat-containing protein-like [Dorcoceras hygrometricum]|uniref:Pentatricopeptide repeat-containing protein-like n=1 Tax=Dorcoceras hygrometricum TaxID=472368 RepID=A0A2Z7AKV1_9LAMI|nr:pentatricopeptide repeat-containing protein-like [Dorcoceras hygrometricum]